VNNVSPNSRQIQRHAPFNFLLVRNQGDKKVEVYLDGEKNPIFLMGASGGSFQIEPSDDIKFNLVSLKESEGANSTGKIYIYIGKKVEA
jgi:hypothetical protein